jgi:hypothetical protein
LWSGNPKPGFRRDLGAFANQLFEGGLVEISETLEPHATSSDVGLGQRFLVTLGDVSRVVACADIQRDIVLVAGQSDTEPVAFPPGRVFEVIGTIGEDADVDERGLLRRCLADQRVEGGDLGLARFFEFRDVFRGHRGFQLTLHDVID